MSERTIRTMKRTQSSVKLHQTKRMKCRRLMLDHRYAGLLIKSESGVRIYQACVFSTETITRLKLPTGLLVDCCADWFSIRYSIRRIQYGLICCGKQCSISITRKSNACEQEKKRKKKVRCGSEASTRGPKWKPLGLVSDAPYGRRVGNVGNGITVSRESS